MFSMENFRWSEAFRFHDLLSCSFSGAHGRGHSFAMAGVGPCGSLSDLHGCVGGEKDLKRSLPTVRSPVLPSEVFDEDEVPRLQTLEGLWCWGRERLLHLRPNA